MARPDVPVFELHCCYDTPLYLIQGDQEFLLSEEPLRDNVSVLKYVLARALKNKYQLHLSITWFE